MIGTLRKVNIARYGELVKLTICGKLASIKLTPIMNRRYNLNKKENGMFYGFKCSIV